MASFRDACFTGFLPTEPTFTPLHQYLIYGKEVCPTTKKEHWQGFVQFKTRTRRNAAQESLGQGKCHIEPRKGTVEQAGKYCKKDEKYTEHGTINDKKPGKRTDLEEFRDNVRAGATDRDLFKHNLSVIARYPNLARQVRAAYSEKRNWVTDVHILWGKTGTGKTRYAMERGSKPVVYTNKFFMGYAGESTVLFDEFDLAATMPLSLLLQLTDRYPMVINIKGGEIDWAPKTIYFTMNKDPQPFITAHPEFARRVTTVREVGEL